MRFLIALILLAWPAGADGEADKALAQAKQLEDKAEALLDQGRRAQAIELLARAADLRDRARAAAKHPPEKAAPKAGKRDATPRQQASRAIAALDQALSGNDMTAAANAAKEARKHLARWERHLAERAAQPPARGAADARVDRRLRSLERQVEELKKALARDATTGAK